MELDALCVAAEAALAGVRLDREAFAAWLAANEAGRELSSSDPSGGPPDAAERAGELALAWAIGRGDPAAARLFDERYVAPLGGALARMRLSEAELDEVKQAVRERLLVVGEGGRARVEDYAGRGRLAGLVHVVATREALTLLRRARHEPARALADDDGALDLTGPLVGAGDPALAMVKAQYRAAFRGAFADAVAALTARERNLLRMHLLRGVKLEQLAAMHGVHRATVVRWLKDARDAVLTRTRASLAATLSVRADEIESLAALAESRLDASIERLLATHDGADQ